MMKLSRHLTKTRTNKKYYSSVNNNAILFISLYIALGVYKKFKLKNLVKKITSDPSLSDGAGTVKQLCETVYKLYIKTG